MIAVGDICVVRQTGAQLWVAKAPAPVPIDRERWVLISKMVDKRGRSAHSSKVVGLGDITLIRPGPEYKVGDVIEHNGLKHVVLKDCGDEVELAVPEDRVPLRGGYTVRVAAGNSTLVSES